MGSRRLDKLREITTFHYWSSSIIMSQSGPAELFRRPKNVASLPHFYRLLGCLASGPCIAILYSSSYRIRLTTGFMIVLFNKYYPGDEIKMNARGGACCTYGERRGAYRVLVEGDLKERVYLADLGVEGRY